MWTSSSASHDIEDVVAVLDGRPGLEDEVAVAPAEVREYLRATLGALLEDSSFMEAIAGHLPGDASSQARLPIVVARMTRLAGGR